MGLGPPNHSLLSLIFHNKLMKLINFSLKYVQYNCHTGVIMTSSAGSCIVLAKHLPIIQNGGNAYPISLWRHPSAMALDPVSSWYTSQSEHSADLQTNPLPGAPTGCWLPRTWRASTSNCWNPCMWDYESPLLGWTLVGCVLPLTL